MRSLHAAHPIWCCVKGPMGNNNDAAQPRRTREKKGMSTVRLEAVGRRNDDMEQPGSEREIPMQPASQDIWDKKYRLKTKSGVAVDADIDRTYQRVAKALPAAEAAAEPQKLGNER